MSVVPFPTTRHAFPAPEGIVLHGEADHRIANNLGLIVGLLRLRTRAVSEQAGKIDRAEVRVLLEDIAARVEMVARLHRMLSQSFRNPLVDIGTYLRELCGSLTGALSPNTCVHVSHHGNACVLPPDQVLTLGMLMSELVTNAAKYAHPTGIPVRIDIVYQQSAAGRLTIEIADDGIGLPENFDPQTDGALGFRIVYSLAAQLGATLSFDSSPLGTCVRLEIPTLAAIHAG